MSNTPTPHDFLDDPEKMDDFIEMSRDSFLASYSYLTHEEYDLTKKHLLDAISLHEYTVEFTSTLTVYATNEEEALRIAEDRHTLDDEYAYVNGECYS